MGRYCCVCIVKFKYRFRQKHSTETCFSLLQSGHVRNDALCGKPSKTECTPSKCYKQFVPY